MRKKMTPPTRPTVPRLSRSPSIELVNVPSTAHLPEVTLFESSKSASPPPFEAAPTLPMPRPQTPTLPQPKRRRVASSSPPQHPGIPEPSRESLPRAASRLPHGKVSQDKRVWDPHTTKAGLRRSATRAEIEVHFGKTIPEAARALNMSVTLLQFACRAAGIRRWPSRRFNTLKYLLEQTPRSRLQADCDAMGHERMAAEYHRLIGDPRADELTAMAVLHFKKLLQKNKVRVDG